MDSKNAEYSEKEYFVLGSREIVLDDFEASGLILDLGGGGEGVIGQLKPKQVIAIDPNQRELEEAAQGPVKIVMDARDLRFLDGAFEIVTSFYTLMYIKPIDHQKVFEEIFRVLKPGGKVLIWDLVLPERLDDEKDIAVIYLTIQLPNLEIKTGYGTRWPESSLSLEYYTGLAAEAGFIVFEKREDGLLLYIELRK